jgi:hypothetical protein
VDVIETEKESEVSDQDGRKFFTVFDVVSCVNDAQESNPATSQPQVSVCTKI